MRYIFIDPFNSENSGVSTYIKAASKYLFCEIIKIGKEESIEEFRRRIKQLTDSIKEETIIEAPETMASTLFVYNPFVKIHIRLHLAKTIGKKIQQIPFSEEEFLNEKEVIRVSHFLSAPSGLILQMTEAHFNIKKRCSIYPNPYKENLFKMKYLNKKYDFIFVGRWQKLKGIEHVLRIADKGFKVCVLSPDFESIKHKNIDAFIGSEENKDIYISQSKYMLAPSLVESFGYIALDGLSRGILVITSENFGLNEFLEKPIFLDFSKDYFKDLNDIIRVSNTENFSLNSINNKFKEGLFSSLEGQYVDLRLHKKEYEFKMAKNSVLHRKIKKFLRDPKQFFKDSKIFSKKGLVEVKKDIQNVVQKKEECCLLEGGKYTFGTFSESKIKGNILFLFPSSETYFSKELVDACKTFKDFSPFQKIVYGFFDTKDNELSDLEIINKIDVKNKTELAKVDFIFIFDGSSSFCSALRSCGPFIKVYSVDINGLFLSQVGDGYIGFQEKNVFPREVIINSQNDLPIAIRRIVQENLVKEIDLLLPVFGSFDYNEEYLKIDTSIEKGIFYIKEYPKEFKTFEELSEGLAAVTSRVLLCDSIYLRYKDLIEGIKKQEDLSILIKALSKDSVKIKFQEEK